MGVWIFRGSSVIVGGKGMVRDLGAVVVNVYVVQMTLGLMLLRMIQDSRHNNSVL